MAFILFMIGLALAVTLVLWLIFRSGKPRPTKKPPTKKKPRRKKRPTTGNTPFNPAQALENSEQLRKNAVELLKKNPQVISQVVRQWLREK